MEQLSAEMEQESWTHKMKTIYILESSTDGGKTFYPLFSDEGISVWRSLFFEKEDAIKECGKYKGFSQNFQLRIVSYERKGIVKTYKNL